MPDDVLAELPRLFLGDALIVEGHTFVVTGFNIIRTFEGYSVSISAWSREMYHAKVSENAQRKAHAAKVAELMPTLERVLHQADD